MKKILIILLLLLLTGCSDYNELNDIGLVSKMYIDYKDKYQVTLEILNNKKPIYIKASGNKLEKALYNASLKTNLKLEYSHMYKVLLSKRSIPYFDDFYDYFKRNINIRKDFNFYISDNIEKNDDKYNIYKLDDSIIGNFRTILRAKLTDQVFYLKEIPSNKIYLVDKDLIKIDDKYMHLYDILYDKFNIEFKYINSYKIYMSKPNIRVSKDNIDIDIKLYLNLVNLYEDKLDIGKMEKDTSKYFTKLFYDSINYSKDINKDLYNFGYIYYKEYDKKIPFDKLKYNIKVKTYINEKGLTYE